ncbi:MAG: Substrate-specific component QueT (COG4708) of predicted queuosine-regulated ECF transporter, partial [uncultured Rubrobacteraceae bacterium]
DARTEPGPQGRDRRGRRGPLRRLEPRCRARRLRACAVQARRGPQAACYQVPRGHPSLRDRDRDHQPLQSLRRCARTRLHAARRRHRRRALLSGSKRDRRCARDLPRLATLRPLDRSRRRDCPHRRRRIALPGRLRLGRRLRDNPAPARKRPTGAPDL